jgi:hypothetical protein
MKTAFDGLDTEPESEAEPQLVKSRNRNGNLSNVGTGSVKIVTLKSRCYFKKYMLKKI